MVSSGAYEKAIRSFWVGRATITVRDGVLDHATGRTVPQERILDTEVPCRISHKTVAPVSPVEHAAQLVQSVVLYADPSVEFPEGSKITVSQLGVTKDYVRSGKPAVFTHHQEVPLELFPGWA